MEDLAVSHIMLGALKGSFRLGCLQFPPSHPRPPPYQWVGFSWKALKAVESLWDLYCTLPTSACLGVWWVIP